MAKSFKVKPIIHFLRLLPTRKLGMSPSAVENLNCSLKNFSSHNANEAVKAIYVPRSPPR